MEYTKIAREAYQIIKASTLKDPSHRGTMWSNCKDLTDIIETSKSDRETTGRVENTCRFGVNPQSEQIRERMVDWYHNYLGGICQSTCWCDDYYLYSVLFTPDELRTAVICKNIEISIRIDPKQFRIMELGGGCGHLAETLKLMIPHSTYIGIDLPESLFFAYVYLRTNFPESRVQFVTDPSQLWRDFDSFDFVFVPTIFAEELKDRQVDLFVNTASMGEMNNQSIRYWMDFIQNKIKVRYFYGLNRFLNPLSVGGILTHDRLNENEASVLFDKNWDILKWELEPPFTRCPYEEPSVVARELEIIAERIMPSQKLVSYAEATFRRESRKLIDDIKDEDWFKHLSKNKNMAMRSNVLCNDLTMTGTLFKLWESIRLDPNTTNVSMMLMYLSTLQRKDYPVEEWFYYRSLLDTFLDNPISDKARQISVFGWMKRPFEVLRGMPMDLRNIIYRGCDRLL